MPDTVQTPRNGCSHYSKDDAFLKSKDNCWQKNKHQREIISPEKRRRMTQILFWHYTKICVYSLDPYSEQGLLGQAAAHQLGCGHGEPLGSGCLCQAVFFHTIPGTGSCPAHILSITEDGSVLVIPFTAPCSILLWADWGKQLLAPYH